MKKLIVNLCGMVASFSLFITALNVNTNCIAFIHQPKLPKGAERLRKF
ncbi:cyclic lactone autoinducer peptide [Fontibacillus solani]|uniref:Cyclic lactone autoinducer peptide n=2 Tax=Fontibacillus TaxID=995014 RepID=A0A1G7GUP0_9BACL|nr:MULTISPECIES: cyclic lactone autoinducer peptide [Fontibacillus]MBA9084165.1 cyclic lactone autoinducer peptide [Fontibacillus solani]SDE91669.1 cyclic lactone autoinducer peptide [Fontibacillus panacisegetis]